MGLHDSCFGGICTTIIGQDPLPSLGEIYSKIIREEQPLASVRGRDQQEAVGFLVCRENQIANNLETQHRTENTILRPRMLCSHCGRTGYEKRDCWQIVGFPDWAPERGGRGQGSNSRGRGGCHSGGRVWGRASAAHATSLNSSEFPESTSE